MSKVSASKKQHRSMRGKAVDMDLLRKRNELTPAVGNARVNARGDELGPGGQIIKKREEIVGEHYAVANASQQRAAATSAIDEIEEVVVEAPVKAAATRTTKKSSSPAEVAAEEAALDETEEWIEDENGNFVKKGE